MTTRTRSLLCSLLSVSVLVLLATPAAALTTYTNVIGTNVDFTGIQESSSFGDPEPLFGQPIGAGNDSINFFPPNFAAVAQNGSFDQTGSQLQLMFETTNPLTFTLDALKIDEFGDTLLLGVGTAATGTFAAMSGFVTVLETTGGPIAPVVIPFVGSFAPTDLLSLPGDAGVTIWTGSAFIDIASVVPNATKAMLSFDNDLTAYSEAGTFAKIQKKVAISVVPEPATVGLLGLGLVGLALAGRERR